MSRRDTNSKKPAPVPTTRCAIYTRKSSDEGLQQEFNSLDAQREAAEAYVASQKAEGWVCLPDRYDDGGFTGGNMDRPGLQRLLRDIDAGKVDCVVVYKVDRLSRSLMDFAKIVETFERHNVSFVSVTQHAGQLGDADLEDRLLRNVDEGRFRAICQNALEGLASKKLNLEMLIERRARAQERRVVPETIARFLAESSGFATLTLKPVANLPHAFDPGRTPIALRACEHEPDWRLPALAAKYPRISTQREAAEEHNLEWVTPGHPLFEAMRRHTLRLAEPEFKKGACFYSLAAEQPSRVDFYRARVVDGLGTVVHERLFAVDIPETGEPRLREPSVLGDLNPASGAAAETPAVVAADEPTAWLHEHALQPFLDEVRGERLDEVERIAEHVELSLTELLQRVDEEIGKAAADVEKGAQGAEGRLKQAEDRHADLLTRRERRRRDLERQRSLTLQGVERLTSVLVLPHPERESPDVRNLRPDAETEAVAMRVAMEHEQAQGRQVYDVSERNLGYDLTSLDLSSGELRLIEVKGIGAPAGTILLTPNEHRVAQDRRDCYWLYVVTNCSGEKPNFMSIKDPAQLPWGEVVKVQHYAIRVQDLQRSASP